MVRPHPRERQCKQVVLTAQPAHLASVMGGGSVGCAAWQQLQTVRAYFFFFTKGLPIRLGARHQNPKNLSRVIWSIRIF